MTHIENAEIESTMLGNEDHGIFTAYVYVKGDCTGGGFGGYGLDEYDKQQRRRIGTAYGCEFIKRILSTLKVETWEKLRGTPVRIDTEGIGGRILRIGHFIENRWFDPRELATEMKIEKVG